METYRFFSFEFSSLPRELLFESMALRERVFTIEQDCHEADLDARDRAQGTVHLGFYDPTDDHVYAYARVLAFGDGSTLLPASVTIGRVCVDAQARKSGLGREIFSRALLQAQAMGGGKKYDICILAQCYLRRFYESFGFQLITDNIIIESGIDHYAMRFTTER